MEKILFIHDDKQASALLQDLCRGRYCLVEIRSPEESVDFIPAADITILHAPSFAGREASIVKELRLAEGSFQLLVLADPSTQPLCESLLEAGATDIFFLGSPQTLLLRRIENLLAGSGRKPQKKELGSPLQESSFTSYRLIESVRKISRLFGLFNNTEKAVGAFLSFVKEMFGASRVCLLEAKNGVFVLSQSIGMPEKLIKDLTFPLENIARFMKKTPSVLRMNTSPQGETAEQALLEMQVLGAAALSPIIKDGRTQGALGIGPRLSGLRFGEGEAELLLYLSEELSGLLSEKKPLPEPPASPPAAETRTKTESRIQGAIAPAEKKPAFPSLSKGEDLYMDFVRTLAMRSSHELKNALVSIKTFTQLLPKKYKSESFRKDFFGVVGKEVDHLNSLVEDLLFFAHPVDLMKEKKNILTTLRDAERDVSEEFRNIRFSNETDKDLALDHSYDEKLIRMALRNILKNSAQSMRGEGIIQAGIRASQSAIGITISDSGEGIPEALRNRIFEPFFTTKTKGLGLGLTIARKILDAHGWSASIESSEAGSRFHIVIPDAAGAQPSPYAEQEGSQPYIDRLLHNHEKGWEKGGL